MEFATLQLKRHQNNILVVSLHRPEVHNAINTQMMVDLRDLWRSLYEDQDGLRCVVLTGSGDKSFCAGADLKQRNNMTVEAWQKQHTVLEQAVLAMIDCPLPIIAAVNGYTFGGGLELMLACDFAYASSEAIFSQSEVKLGIMPGAMATQNLPKACGIRRAKEIVFTAQSFGASEALSWGVVNQVVEPAQLLSQVLSVAEAIAANAPLAVMQVKQALNASQGCDVKTGYTFELEAYNRLVPTEDRLEGIKAFNEKRKPDFKGK